MLDDDPLVVDIAHWRLEDKTFQAERKAKWPMIAALLSYRRKKKAINVIKKYYLKGELPDWYYLWGDGDDGDHFLDPVVFIWLHPSSDYEVLLPLVRAYFKGYGRRADEMRGGMSLLITWGISNAAHNGETYEGIELNAFEGKAKLIFDLMVADEKNGKWLFGTPPREYPVIWRGLNGLMDISFWLNLEKLNRFGQDMLYQWDGPLELTFKQINRDTQAAAKHLEMSIERFAKILFRIAYFDVEKEGDTVRTRTVCKLRALLDKEDNIPELKELWRQVKSGEKEVKDPWLDE